MRDARGVQVSPAQASSIEQTWILRTRETGIGRRTLEVEGMPVLTGANEPNGPEMSDTSIGEEVLLCFHQAGG